MSYSPFFQALHDETGPVSDFGRGTHYSVLRVPMGRTSGSILCRAIAPQAVALSKFRGQPAR